MGLVTLMIVVLILSDDLTFMLMQMLKSDGGVYTSDKYETSTVIYRGLSGPDEYDCLDLKDFV